MPKIATDWSGYQYSFLKVIGPGETRDSHGRRKWLVQCVCGATKEMDIRDLLRRQRSGLAVSCGCKKAELISQALQKHGMTKHPAYSVWHSMIQRCTEPTHPAWKNYGGRGITVCERWLHDFAAFWNDMGPTYQPGLDIDRKENEKGYSPENCRWVTRKVNCRNKRNTRTTTYLGQTVTVKSLSELSGIKYTTLLYRLNHGCPPERLLEEPDTARRFTT